MRLAECSRPPMALLAFPRPCFLAASYPSYPNLPSAHHCDRHDWLGTTSPAGSRHRAQCEESSLRLRPPRFWRVRLHLMRARFCPTTHGVLLTQAGPAGASICVGGSYPIFFWPRLSEPIQAGEVCWRLCSNYNVLVSYWWMFAPALALVVVSLGYLSVANAFQ